MKMPCRFHYYGPTRIRRASGTLLAALLIACAWSIGAPRMTPVYAAPALDLHPQQPPPAETTDQENQPPLSDSFLKEYDQIVAGRAERDARDPDPSVDSGASLASSLTVALIVIGGLIYAGVWLLRQYRRRQGGLPIGAGLLSLQETRQLGPNQKLHLVQLGEDLLLLGATDQNISFLARYRSDDLPESFAEHLEGAGGPAAASGALFADVLGSGGGLLQESLEQLRRMRSGGSGDD